MSWACEAAVTGTMYIEELQRRVLELERQLWEQREVPDRIEAR